MALRMAVHTPQGVETENGYMRIDGIAGDKGCISMTVSTFLSEEARQNGKAPLEQRIIGFAPSLEAGAPNFIAQGYEYLKGLPEYEGAVDC